MVSVTAFDGTISDSGDAVRRLYYIEESKAPYQDTTNIRDRRSFIMAKYISIINSK